MASSSDWQSAKRQELAWIEAVSGVSVEMQTLSPECVLTYKESVRKKILGSSFSKWVVFSETNTGLHPGHLKLNGYVFSYRYQRFDMKISGPLVYPNIPSSDYYHGTVYVNSGMSAISTVLHAINRVKPDWTLLVGEGCYYESLHVMTNLCERIKVIQYDDVDRESVENHILYVDSYSQEPFSFNSADMNTIRLVVVDTTCWSADSINDESFFSIYSELKCPLLLVRSHVKLDSLGMEYGQLGSVTTLCPIDVSTEVLDFIIELVNVCHDYITVFGILANPLSFGPFFGRECQSVAESRVIRIRKNNVVLGEHFKKDDNCIVKVYRHELFLTIKQPSVPDEMLALGYAETITDTLEKILPTRIASSFGFDYMTIFSFLDDESGLWGLRVCAGDVPESNLKAWATLFCVLLRLKSSGVSQK